jgi:hypothetical protein
MSAARVAPRLTIGGNVSQSSSVGGSNNTGLVGNIIDNSGNNGIIQNVGQDKRRDPEAEPAPEPLPVVNVNPRLSIGGNDNVNNAIGLNNGTGNIIDNSGNTGDLHNSGQNNNGGLVVKAPRISIGGDKNQNNVIGVNNGQGNIIDNSGNSGTQWENFSITSMEVDFWGVKSSGCENSHVTEVKCSNIPQKS